MFGGTWSPWLPSPAKRSSAKQVKLVDEESIRGHEGVGAAAKYRLLYMYDER
jgi:hypothetical protein